MGRETVAQEMRIDLIRIESSHRGPFLHDLPDARRGETAAIAIQENMALGLFRNEVRPHCGKIFAYSLASSGAHWHQAGLVAFSSYSDPAFLKAQMLQPCSRQLTHA